jgi:hypothetical protein
MLSWDQYGFDKKCIGTRYAELSFLYPVGSASQAVHFGASEERVVETRFFKLRWDQYRFFQKALQDTLCQTFVFASGGLYG